MLLVKEEFNKICNLKDKESQAKTQAHFDTLMLYKVKKGVKYPTSDQVEQWALEQNARLQKK